MTRILRLAGLLAGFALAACAETAPIVATKAQPRELPPPMRWDHKDEAPDWTEATLVAISTHGSALETVEPADIVTWCPGYPAADTETRRAFWAGLLSTLAKYESTWQPEVQGGGGKWIGLLQIAPATARGYGCEATNVAALQNGSANLSCGVRIISETVIRDGVIAERDSRWRGIAADWTPFRKDAVRAEMAAWTAGQSYCQPG